MNSGFADWTTASLWLAVVVSGVYHGITPGMGWPLAVSAGLMGGHRRDLLTALGSLAVGHFLAMAGILLPSAAITGLIFWQQEIRIAAGLIVVATGLWLLAYRRHPRFVARIPPTRLALWSFVVATAHGAGLMLLPIYLGLCRAAEPDAGHEAAAALVGANLSTAILVSLVHTAAMVAAGGAMAFAAFEWLGPRFIERSWFNLETAWALSLLLVGGIGLTAALAAG